MRKSMKRLMITVGVGFALCALVSPARADFLPGSYTYKLVLRDDLGFALCGKETSEEDERVSANYTTEVYNAAGDKLNATVADASIDGDTGCHCSVSVPVGDGAGRAKVGETLDCVIVTPNGSLDVPNSLTVASPAFLPFGDSPVRFWLPFETKIW